MPSWPQGCAPHAVTCAQTPRPAPEGLCGLHRTLAGGFLPGDGEHTGWPEQDGLGRRSSCAGGRTGPAAAGRRTSGLGAGWAGSRCPRKRLSPERVCPRHKASREHTGRRNNARVSAWTLLGRSWVNRHQDPSPLRAPRLTCRCLPLAGSDSRPAGLPSGLGAGATVTERKKRPGHRGLPSSKRHPT